METDPTGTLRHAHGPAEHQFELTGGRACLDFVNTVSGDRGGHPRERLGGYADLLAWARQSCVLDAAHARRLLAEARRRPADADAILRDAIALREALYRVFTAVAERRDPPEEDLATTSASVARALAHRRLARGEDGFAFAWEDAPGALDAPLWRLASSAADLLTSRQELARVRVCGLHETHECSWVFLDTTKGRTRRWCSMKDCGNRAKARRHYARARQRE
jgi:predicted RNA-binding Zn ribbon-like protein